MTTKFDQDDALGAGAAGEDYNDQQGVFATSGPPSGRTGAQANASGAGAAKVFLFGFIAVLVLCVGWVGWKFAHRRAAPDESVPVPVTYAASLPMMGAPGAEENTPPVAPAAMAPTGTLRPGAPSVAPASAGAAVPVAPIQQRQIPGAAEAIGGALAPRPAAPSTAGAAVVVTAAPPAQAAPAPAATSQDDIREQLAHTIRRVDALQHRVDILTRKEHPSATWHHRAPPPTHVGADVASKRKPPVKPAPKVPPGVVLKAVVEGRAWLQLSSGETITVAQGDQVAGLGAVSSIDAERGEVRFADGVVLR